MKRITIIAICAFAVSMVSCKKEQTCTCTTTVLGQADPDYPVVSTTIKDTKKKAKEACERGNSSFIFIETKCEIK